MLKEIKTQAEFKIQKTEFYMHHMWKFFKSSQDYLENTNGFNSKDIKDEDYTRLYRFTQSIKKSSFAFLDAMEAALISSYLYSTIKDGEYETKKEEYKAKSKIYNYISNQPLGMVFRIILGKKKKLKCKEIICNTCCKKEHDKTKHKYPMNKEMQELILKNLNKTKVFNENIEIKDFTSRTITEFRNKIMHHKFLFGLSNNPENKNALEFIPEFFKPYVNIFNSYEQTRYKLYILKNFSKWYKKPSNKISKYVFEICKKYFFLKDKIVLEFCKEIKTTSPEEFQASILKKIDELKKQKNEN